MEIFWSRHCNVFLDIFRVQFIPLTFIVVPTEPTFGPWGWRIQFLNFLRVCVTHSLIFLFVSISILLGLKKNVKFCKILGMIDKSFSHFSKSSKRMMLIVFCVNFHGISLLSEILFSWDVKNGKAFSSASRCVSIIFSRSRQDRIFRSITDSGEQGKKRGSIAQAAHADCCPYADLFRDRVGETIGWESHRLCPHEVRPIWPRRNKTFYLPPSKYFVLISDLRNLQRALE